MAKLFVEQRQPSVDMVSKEKWAAPRTGSMRSSFSARRPPRILCVDDDTQVRVFLKRVLAREGYKVDTAESGVEAWEALNDVAYTLLITDHDMPRMTGWELVTKARRFEMDLAIIMMSGLFDVRMDPDWERLAIAGFFPKPFTITEILDAVNQIHSVGNHLGRGSARPGPQSKVPRFSSVQPYNHGGINE